MITDLVYSHFNTRSSDNLEVSPCLLNQCQNLESKLESLIAMSLDNGTFISIVEDLRVSMENKNDCDNKNVCPNLSQFQDFYFTVQKLLLEENDFTKRGQIYQRFIRSHFDVQGGSILSKDDYKTVEKTRLHDRKCQSSFAIQCQKLVSDFMFLNMIKVGVQYIQ